MSETAFSPKILAAWLATALFLYVSSYAFVCRTVPSGVSVPTLHKSPGIPNGGTDDLCIPSYRFGGRFSAGLYRPLQILDKNLFPGRWRQPAVEGF